MNRFIRGTYSFLIVGGTIIIVLVVSTIVLSTALSLPSELTVAILALMGTVLASVLVAMLGRNLETQARIEQDIREKKIPIYQQFLAALFTNMMAEKVGKPKLTDKELMQQMSEFVQGAIVWGSPEMIQVWNEIRTAGQTGALDPKGTLLLYERLMLTMRKDLGHNADNFDQGELVRLFVNDFDDALIAELRVTDDTDYSGQTVASQALTNDHEQQNTSKNGQRTRKPKPTRK